MSTASSGQTCGGNCGITRERARQQASARALATRVSQQRFSEGDLEAVREMPVESDEIDALAEELLQIIPARRIAVPADLESAPSLYFQLGLEAPSLLECIAGRANASERLDTPDEVVLRVLFSPFGRYYSLQQINLDVRGESDGMFITTEHHVGLSDRRMQWIVKGIQGFLRKRKVTSLDVAFLLEPAENAPAQTLWQVLFEPTGPQQLSCTHLPQPMHDHAFEAERAIAS